MPDIDTPRLGLPLIAAAQAQKHVTHNEALLALDAVVQLSCLDRDLAAPPLTPAEGAAFIVAPAPTGPWAGYANQVAVRRDGVWRFTPPSAGFVAYVVDERILCLFDGTGWVELSKAIRSVQNLDRLGIGTLADAVNAFAARLNTALWTARAVGEGGTGDLRLTFNKEAAGKVLSLLFQTGFGARAELGLIGTDDLRVRVSPDGATWIESLRVERATGALFTGAALVATSQAAGGFPVAGALSALEVRCSSAGPNEAAFMAFHRPGRYALYLGMDSDNELKLGGWSHGSTKSALFHAGRTCAPGLDNTYNLGSPSFRFGNVFAASGIVNSSDSGLKARRGPLRADEMRAWGRVRATAFQWDDAIAAKGSDGARFHVGYLAQEVEAAFRAEGLDASRYGLFCSDPLHRKVTRTHRVRRPRMEEVSVSGHVIEMVDGRLVRRATVSLEQRPVTERRPVHSEDGEPIPDLFSDIPVFDDVEEECEDLEETGERRLGLRYDQCAVFENAWLRSRLAELEAEIGALRDRVSWLGAPSST